jgi:hypothetical protein
MNSMGSYLLIHSVSVTCQRNFENECTIFISKVKITPELRYVVFVDPEAIY